MRPFKTRQIFLNCYMIPNRLSRLGSEQVKFLLHNAWWFGLVFMKLKCVCHENHVTQRMLPMSIW